jgi:DNA-binding winged helix-turn-helix (wHTH) protein
MKYVLNLTVAFDFDSRRLSLRNDDRIFIDLTKPATRLLIELIKNNRTNTSREDLLNNVWINYGFSASNASLNNYISELRRSFATLEMNRDVIITIPKVGFRLDADIQTIARFGSPETCKEQVLDDLSVAAEQPDDSTTQVKREGSPAPPIDIVPPQIEAGSNSATVAKTTNLKATIKIKLLSLCLALLVLFIYFMATKPDNTVPVEQLFQEGQCTIYSLGPDKDTPNMLSRIKLHIAKMNIDCRSVKRDVFYIEELPEKNVNNTIFISVCDKSEDNQYRTCRNKFEDTRKNIK